MKYADPLQKENLPLFSGHKYILICPYCEELFAERDDRLIQNLDEPTFLRHIRHRCRSSAADELLERMTINEYLRKYTFSEKPV